MTSNDTKNLNEQMEEYDIPLDISDIINVCREYNKLGWEVQAQIENILSYGVEESIRNYNLKKESLSFIKVFLKFITQNPYFGDATSQANDCINLINKYQDSLNINKNNMLN